MERTPSITSFVSKVAIADDKTPIENSPSTKRKLDVPTTSAKNMNQKSIKTDQRENTLIAICNLDSTTQETKTILIHFASYIMENCQTKPCYQAN